MSTTLIKNGFIYTATQNPICIERGWICIQNGKIKQLGSMDDAKLPEADVEYDATGKLILPGLINPHWHESFIAPNFERADDVGLSCTAYACGGDIEALGSLFGFISSVPNRLTEQEALAIARWSLWTQLRSGTTAIGDIGSANSGKALAQAALDLNMRIRLSRWGADIQIPNNASQYKLVADGSEQIHDVEQLIESYHKHESGLLGVMPSVMGAFACSDNLLLGMGNLAKKYDLPFATHLAALKNEREAVQRIFGVAPVERFNQFGLVNSRLLSVHSAYLTEDEYELFVEEKVNICHSPAHYGMLGEKTLSETGVLTQFLKDDANISTSTDGDISFTGGMTEALRACHLNHNEVSNDNTTCSPNKALLTGTRVAATALGWEDKIGDLTCGKEADLVFIDVTDYRYKNSPHPLRTFLLTGSSKDVESVMVGGNWVLLHGEPTGNFSELDLWDDYCSAVTSARQRIKP